MILERYLIRNYIGPFVFSMSVITFVFIMDFLLRYIDLFLGKGVSLWVVSQTFFLSLGHMFALIIPMAVLPATLMTFGNLASENELTAMKASGISLYRMILPGAIGAALLAVALVAYNNYVLPESNHKLMSLLVDINRKKPAMSLRENQFVDEIKDYVIYIQDKNDKTGDIYDVQIFRRQRLGTTGVRLTSIVAERGKFTYLARQNVLRFDLLNGELHEMPTPADRRTYRRTNFENYTMNIRDIDRSLKRSERTHRGDREMSVDMMREKIAELTNDITAAENKIVEVANRRMNATLALLDHDQRIEQYSAKTADTKPEITPGATTPRQLVRNQRTATAADRAAQQQPPARAEYITRQELETQNNVRTSYFKQIDRYNVEIHKKFSIPFACLVFVLVGSPVAIRTGRSGMNTAIGLSILFFLVYYVCLIGGEKLADRGLVEPWLAMWLPNIIFGVLAVFMLRSAARELSTGEPPINFKRILERFRRRHDPAHP